MMGGRHGDSGLRSTGDEPFVGLRVESRTVADDRMMMYVNSGASYRGGWLASPGRSASLGSSAGIASYFVGLGAVVQPSLCAARPTTAVVIPRSARV
jgi:hypothetical protein